MNNVLLKQSLVAIGLLSMIGAVGAQAYYSRELVQRVAAQESAPAPVVPPGDPWTAMRADMQRMQAEMEQAFDNAFHRFPAVEPAGPSTEARVSLQEDDGNYLVKATIPGAKESDINVQLDGRLLSISSQIQGGGDEKAGNGEVIGQERYSSSFQQAFTLPGPVNATGMQMDFEDGVLTLTIPKATS